MREGHEHCDWEIKRLEAYRTEITQLKAEVERLKQDMRQFYFDHGLLLGENARLKRVEESAKNLLDSCLEAEAEQGDEEDYIVRLRAENAKLRKVVEAAKDVVGFGAYHDENSLWSIKALQNTIENYEG